MASAKLQYSGFSTFREIYRKPLHKISELTVGEICWNFQTPDFRDSARGVPSSRLPLKLVDPFLPAP